MAKVYSFAAYKAAKEFEDIKRQLASWLSEMDERDRRYEREDMGDGTIVVDPD